MLLPLVRFRGQVANDDFPDDRAQNFDGDGAVTLTTGDSAERQRSQHRDLNLSLVQHFKEVDQPPFR